MSERNTSSSSLLTTKRNITCRRSPRLAASKENNISEIENEENIYNTKKHNIGGFGGSIGCFLMILFLPLFTLFICISCENKEKCIYFNDISKVKEIYNISSIMNNIWTLEAQIIVIGWIIFQAILYIILPGEIIKGLSIKELKGKKLKYKMNGLLQFFVTILIICIGYPKINKEKYIFIGFESYPLNRIYDIYIPLITSSIIMSYIISILLYIYSYRNNNSVILSEGGNTKNIFIDFFMGRELNPRIINYFFDLKVFFDLRPSLIGWTILNISYAYTTYYNMQYISWSFILLIFFQAIYVCDALIFESAILSSIDITTEGLGFMLVFGDVTWVPFMYSLQGRYLMHSENNLSFISLFIITLIFFLGYWIFRASNLQKHTYRTNPSNPSVSHLKTMPTKTGKKLLISGWWGLARKINYLGDIIMGLAWCLLAGTESPIPLFYFFYIIVLLGHRAWRDEKCCSIKYGKDWITYKENVKYIFIPKIF